VQQQQEADPDANLFFDFQDDDDDNNGHSSADDGNSNQGNPGSSRQRYPPEDLDCSLLDASGGCCSPAIYAAMECATAHCNAIPVRRSAYRLLYCSCSAGCSFTLALLNTIAA
jgi:hypothetical protein